jgi:hypothetical protein
MGGRALIVSLLGLMVLSASIFYSITRSSESLMKNVDKYYLRQEAQNIAQSGANLALRQLSKDGSWRTGFPLMDALDGKLQVQVKDTTYNSKYVVKITSTGIMYAGKPFEQRATSVAYLPSGFLPAALKAAITTNNPIRTLGNLTVDGREHTRLGVLIPNSGTLGIWTTKTLSQSGSSTIGGTRTGIDYAPAKPGNPNIIATGQVWPGGYPGTPDSVLGGSSRGYPEGRLKAIAQSGIGGSQYVTNPNLLTTPLRGVTYVELPSGGTWQSMDITGTGILIVHNTAKNAGMKNLNQGTFTGLVIADDVVHIHSTIIGGLICLTPAPSEGNCIGNGNGDVLYSSEAIISATGGAGTASGGGNGSSGGGVVAWWE